MGKEQKFDCPLCGKSDVITRSATHEETKAGPDQGGKGLKRVLGNYTMATVGGEYDYSHADACPNLKQVIEKKDLLAYYLGTNNCINSDLATFDEYEEMFKEIGVVIDSKNISQKTSIGKQWVVSMFLTYKGKEIKEFPAAVARTIEEAFSALRHKILCGEVIPVKNKKWQAVSQGTGGIPKLVELK